MLVELHFKLTDDINDAIRNCLSDSCLMSGFQTSNFGTRLLEIDVSTSDWEKAAQQIYDKFLQIVQSVANEHNTTLHIPLIIIAVDRCYSNPQPGLIIDKTHRKSYKNIMVKPIS